MKTGRGGVHDRYRGHCDPYHRDCNILPVQATVVVPCDAVVSVTLPLRSAQADPIRLAKPRPTRNLKRHALAALP